MDFLTSQEEQEYQDFWNSLNNENLTEEEYLSRVLGPKHLPPKLVIPLTLAYVTIFVSGVVGNFATCVVIIKHPTMHSATNYYLFSLAISDLILLSLGLPNELSSIWQQYPWALGLGLCKIRAYVSEMSSYVSVLTIVAFSMERYLAICHPLRTYSMSGPERPIMIILAVWLIAVVSALPFAIYTKVNYVEYPPDSGIDSASSAICAMLLPDMPHFPLYELSSVVFFLIPMLIILIVYTRMGLKIRKSTRNSPTGESSAHWDSRQVQSRRSIIRMLSAVVIMFFLCWAPFHAQRLLYVYAQEADYYPDLNEWLYIFSGFLYYFSTTINPILYNLMSLRYRKAFRHTICCSKARNGRRGVHGRESDLCRCDSQRTPHTLTIRCSVRQTIDQAKNMFKLNKNPPEHEKETKLPMDVHKTRDSNRNTIIKPLLEDQHPLVGGKTSCESTTSGDKNRESISTVCSFP